LQSQGQPEYVPEVTGRLSGRGRRGRGVGGAVRARRGKGPTRSVGSIEDKERVEALQRNRRAVTEACIYKVIVTLLNYDLFALYDKPQDTVITVFT